MAIVANFERKNTFIMFPGGSYFMGLDNKIIGFVRIQQFLHDDRSFSFLQFEINIATTDTS